MINNKRGDISGVEVIISFTLFLTFLIFIFAYMNPLNMPASRSLLTVLENSVNENATIEMNVVPFAINKQGVTQPCFSILNKFGDNFFITDKDGNQVDFRLSDSNLLIQNTGKFYNINIGIKRNPTLTGSCVLLTPGEAWAYGGLEYSLSSLRTKIYYKKESFAAFFFNDFTILAASCTLLSYPHYYLLFLWGILLPEYLFLAKALSF